MTASRSHLWSLSSLGNNRFIQQILPRVYHLSFQPTILVEDLPRAGDCASNWGHCRFVEKWLQVEQAHEDQAETLWGWQGQLPRYLWDGGETADGLESPCQPRCYPEPMTHISRYLSKTSHPVFLKYWSQYFSFFVTSDSSIIILLVVQTLLKSF